MTACITGNRVGHQKIADTLFLFAVFCLQFLSAVSQDIPVDWGCFHKHPHKRLVSLHPRHPLSLPVFQRKCAANAFFFFSLSLSMKKELISLRQSEEIWCTIRSARISSGNKSAMPASARWWEVVRLERTAVTNILWHSSHRKCVGCGSPCVKG